MVERLSGRASAPPTAGLSHLGHMNWTEPPSAPPQLLRRGGLVGSASRPHAKIALLQKCSSWFRCLRIPSGASGPDSGMRVAPSLCFGCLGLLGLGDFDFPRCLQLDLLPGNAPECPGDLPK